MGRYMSVYTVGAAVHGGQYMAGARTSLASRLLVERARPANVLSMPHARNDGAPCNPVGGGVGKGALRAFDTTKAKATDKQKAADSNTTGGVIN